MNIVQSTQPAADLAEIDCSRERVLWLEARVKQLEHAAASAIPPGWDLDLIDNEAMVVAPNGDPGFKYVQPGAGRLEQRLLYALVRDLVLQNRARKAAIQAGQPAALLSRAAALLNADAESLKQSHTVGGNGDWGGDLEVKAAHDEMRAVAKALLQYPQPL